MSVREASKFRRGRSDGSLVAGHDFDLKSLSESWEGSCYRGNGPRTRREEGAPQARGELDTAYLYDGWNMVAELNAGSGNTTLRTYVWGTDLSGSRDGAGGVGGLLWVNNAQAGLPTGIQFAAYDGNGNVAGLFAASDGSSTARYEYGPFGEPLRLTGSLAKANPIRWSTKVTDDEGGLVYYGYRFYNASTGRWISRDPIQEKGGLNLYGFLRNDGLDRVDAYGLEDTAFGWPVPQPNTTRYGDVHHGLHEMYLNYTDCCDCSKITRRLYDQLKKFENWQPNSVSDLYMQGNYGLFLPADLATAQLLVLGGNSPNFMVQFSHDDSTMCVSARTLNGHPLTGVRKWCVQKQPGPGCKVRVSTEAYEQFSSFGNFLGSKYADVRESQSQIWRDYLNNIRVAEAAEGRCLMFGSDTKESNDSAKGGNPWL